MYQTVNHRTNLKFFLSMCAIRNLPFVMKSIG